MAEYTANTLQTVGVGQDVLLTETAVWGNNSIMHREGSGLVLLRGLTNQCRARFKVYFGGNIAISTDGTVEPISLAITISGEAIPTSSMIVTPAAAEDFFNVGASIFIDVPKGCCVNISVRNISTQAIDVQNANFIVERVA